VKLMPPQFVKPYLKSQKNDMRDAEANLSAAVMPPYMVQAVRCRLNKPPV